MVSVCFNKYFRLPVCLGKNSIVLNSGRNSISSIQFHSHKLLQSWTLKQPHSFSCPVVYQEQENTLISVIDKNILVMWDYESDTLEGAKKIKFHDDIFAIVSVADQQLVVFNSGSCLLLENAISNHEFLAKMYLKSEEELLWVDAAQYLSSVLVFLLTSTHNGVHKLHVQFLNRSDGQVSNSTEQVVSRDSATLKSWCIKSEDTHISFLTIWSDGQVFSYYDDCKPCTHLLTVPGVAAEEVLTVEALNSYHIVVVRSLSSSENSYEIWDTRYAVKKSCKSIDPAVSKNLQLMVLDETLFLPSNQGIVAEPLKVAFSTAAAVVGKNKNSVEAKKMEIYSLAPNGKWLPVPENGKCDNGSISKFSRVTTNELFKELLTRLHKKDAKTVSSHLKAIEIISESKLVKLLQYLLRENAEGLSTKHHAAEIFPEFFRIPYNDILLQQHLRKLSFEETVATLQVLLYLLNYNQPCVAQYGCNNHQSLLAQFLNWTCSLLFSHFEEFVLSTKREISTMKEISKIVINMLKVFGDVGNLLQFQNKVALKNSTSTSYCIENLNL